MVTATGPKRALVYFGANAGPGTPRADYIAGVIAAARAWALPREAIEAIEAIGRAEAGALRRGRR